MRFVYVDESGNTGTKLDDPLQPLLVLTALVIPPSEIRRIETAVRNIGEKYFGPQARDTDFEFHGAEIYQKKGRYFSKIDQKKSFEILDDLVNIVCSDPGVGVGYVAIDKKKYDAPSHIQRTAFTLLIEQVELHLKKVPAHGLLICDENQEVEQLLIDDLDRYKQVGTDFGYNRVPVEQLVDSVHFVKSNNNSLMQLCDVICYVLCRGIIAGERLVKAYRTDQADPAILSGEVSFSDWLSGDKPHKGDRYFYQKKQKLQFTFSNVLFP